MNKNLPAFLAIGIVTLFLLAAGWSAVLMQSPADQLAEQMAPKLEEAQRILGHYSPDSGRLAGVLESGQAQPVQLDPQSPLAQLQALHNQQISQKTRDLPKGARQRDLSYPELHARLQEDESALDQALAAVNAALLMSAGSGVDAANGRTDPHATRLKAMLLYHQAELNRRQASVHYEQAEAARHTFRDAFTRWGESETHARALQYRLTGEPITPLKIESIRVDGSAPTLDEPSEASDADNGSKLSASKTINEMRAEIEKQASDLRPDIAATQARISDLEARVADVETRLKAAQATARQANLRMMALDEEKRDPLDPGALDRFTEAYQKASLEYRRASREAVVLEKGGLRNARLSTDDEEQLLTAPLEPNQGGAIAQEVGLLALQSDLESTRQLLKTQQEAASEFNRQLAALDQEKSNIERELAQIQQRQAKLTDQATQAAQQATGHVIEALALEQQALSISGTQGSGPIAAQAAASAAGKYSSATSNFIREQNPNGPSVRLDYITQHTQTLADDFAFETALIQAQQARELQRQVELLVRTEAMNIPDTKLLGENVAADQAPAAAIRSADAASQANLAYQDALAAANEALTGFEESNLAQSWVVAANKAAVLYLLARIADNDEAAQQYRDSALDIYQRVPTDDPDAKRLAPIIQGLAKQ